MGAPSGKVSVHLLFQLWPHTGAEACRRGAGQITADHGRSLSSRAASVQQAGKEEAAPAPGAEWVGAKQEEGLIESEQHKWTFTIVKVEDPVWTSESVMKWTEK